MAAVDGANYPSTSSCGGGGIRVEDLKRVNINQLSQRELLALSSSSASAFDLHRTDDVVTPQIDRALFNESAGSRRQTYSRLHPRSYSRIPGLHASLKPQHDPHAVLDPVNHSIVHFLKHFINGNHNPPPPSPPPPQPQEAEMAVEVPLPETEIHGIEGEVKIQRRRMRKGKNLNQSKLLENGVGIELQLVNGKGEAVETGRLEKKGDELFAEELKRRTAGLETEEGVLGFLWGLEGQWCSRRKKRKYVDAGLLGDALPIGWKILLGLRRRDYRVSVYCRRFISPTGQQYISCKEVASFLKSYFGSIGADQYEDQKTSDFQQAYGTTSEKQNTSPAGKADQTVNDTVACSTMEGSSSKSRRIDDCLMEIENLPEVQVKDMFECSKCKLTFDDNNVYLQHLLSFHQKTTKRYRFRTPVGQGVIIKDGKFECQFCHKVFDERRSYSGHVGIHVRNSGKNSNEAVTLVIANENTESLLHETVPSTTLKMDDTESPLHETVPSTTSKMDGTESPLHETVPSTTSKLDALAKIAHNSVFENSTVGNDEIAPTDTSASIEDSVKAEASPGDHTETLSSDFVEMKEDDRDTDRALIEDLNKCTEVMTEKNDVVKNEFEWNVNVEMDPSCMNDSGPAGSSEMYKFDNINLDVGYGSTSLKQSADNLENTHELAVGEMVYQDGGSSMPLVQSFQFFPPFSSSSDKGQHEFSIVDPKLENVTGFEELRFDDIEPYGFGAEQEMTSLTGGSMNLGNDSVMEMGFSSSVRFGSEGVILNPVDTNQLTVCVWCRSEFRLEGIESETPSDSIGYMCPTCKAKISGHFGGSLSMDLHDF